MNKLANGSVAGKNFEHGRPLAGRDPVPGARLAVGYPVVHIGGHGLPEEMTSDRRAHPVDAWMTGSCDVMLQVEELP